MGMAAKLERCLASFVVNSHSWLAQPSASRFGGRQSVNPTEILDNNGADPVCATTNHVNHDNLPICPDTTTSFSISHEEGCEL